MNNKKFLGTLVVLGSFITLPLTVNAEEGYVKVTGNNKAYTGDNVNVSLTVSNDAKEGLGSLGGDLVYDNTTLELTNVKEENNNYYFGDNQIADNIHRIAFLDLTGENGMKGDTLIYTFTFKTLKEGKTSVSFENCELSTSGDANIIDCKTSPLEISVEDKKEVEEEKTAPIKEVNNNAPKENVKEVTAPKVKEEKKVNNEVEKVNDNNIESTDTEKEDKKEDKSEIKEEKEESKSEKENSIIDIIRNFFINLLKIFK